MQYEVFMAGTRADNSGKTVTITPDDVANIAKSYHPNFHEAPIVIGHPSDNAPAYGWVKSLSAKDGKLFAEFGEMDEGFVGLVKAGRYKKISASFYPPKHPSNPKPDNWYLRHIGFLGAVPPAVKGLSAINFNDDEAGVVCFGELSEIEQFVATMQNAFANFNAWFKGADFHEPADGSNDRPSNVGANDYSPSTDNPNDNPLINHPPTNGADDMKELNDAIARAEKAEQELAEFKAKQAKDKRESVSKANSDFAENLVKAGQIKPCDKDLLVQVLNFAEFPNDTTADFGEGDDKKPLAVALKDFLKTLPSSAKGLTGEFVRGSVNFNEHLSHHERAVALMKSENISYEEAAHLTA
ncbi:2-oxoacid:acceptor oxidoreductase [Moraxella catarrhalis]|uniref:hypothetical protein n=2 Tax=Moraxella catarrhalis TaxID=480 RepID=UPI0007E3C1B7|nr:hypothetical protein [Moraxella catarrhalis]MPY07398.1 2-oxoacid:acceptor oxidoreductase [Moraxella catarrhalis]OAV31733.1 hypothetical protein AO367_0253 [Moraxella catarrhalis]RKM24077.1 2-oxoacid:acceptor oxidoreductase [Moraxella catarrhalis]